MLIQGCHSKQDFYLSANKIIKNDKEIDSVTVENNKKEQFKFIADKFMAGTGFGLSDIVTVFMSGFVFLDYDRHSHQFCRCLDFDADYRFQHQHDFTFRLHFGFGNCSG